MEPLSALPEGAWPQGRPLDHLRACLGLKEAVADYYPEAQWQRCMVHFYRNVFSHVLNAKVKDVAKMLEAPHAQESLLSAKAKARDIADQLRFSKVADWSKAPTMTGFQPSPGSVF